MFDRIAGVYDLMNSAMTAGMHHQWRERAVDRAEVGAGSDFVRSGTEHDNDHIADVGNQPVGPLDEQAALIGDKGFGHSVPSSGTGRKHQSGDSSRGLLRRMVSGHRPLPHAP